MGNFKDFKEKVISEPDMSKLCFDTRYDTKILIVRHGQSIGNATRRFLGTTDLDLSPLGYRQAYRTAEYLASENIDEVYSSDLLRAYNTALPNAKIRGLEVKTSKELRETYAGRWEGMCVDDILATERDKFVNEWRGNFGLAVLPEGESVPHARERFHSEVLKIALENKGKTVLIAAHAAVIRAFWGKITNTAPEELASAYFYPENASVSVVYLDKDKLIPGEYSHDQHLNDLKE